MAAAPIHRLGQLGHACVVGAQGMHAYVGIHRLQARCALQQMRLANIDGHIFSGTIQMLQQQRRLGGAATAQLDQYAVCAYQLDHLRAVALQNAGLGAGGVVLGRGADQVEQLRASCIIKILGRDAARILAQGRADRV